jgi:hypothetical protein
MPWMKEFNGTEMQLICDDLTVEGLGKYPISKLWNLSCIRLCPMARTVSLPFNLVPVCICLYLFIECLGEKTLALLLLLRFSLLASLLRLMESAIVSGTLERHPLVLLLTLVLSSPTPENR